MAADPDQRSRAGRSGSRTLCPYTLSSITDVIRCSRRAGLTETLTESWGPLAQPLHAEVPDDPRPWRDNAFLCFWDPAKRLTGVMHVSASPNATGGRRARVSVRLGNATVEVLEPL